jgi:hypothetical protein
VQQRQGAPRRELEHHATPQPEATRPAAARCRPVKIAKAVGYQVASGNSPVAGAPNKRVKQAKGGAPQRELEHRAARGPAWRTSVLDCRPIKITVAKDNQAVRIKPVACPGEGIQDRHGRIGQDKPAVGDIVCWSRPPDVDVDYDHQKNGDYQGHCDLIVSVDVDRIWVIGGNVGNSVTKRPLQLNSDKFLIAATQSSETLFAIMQDRIGSVAGTGVALDHPVAWCNKVSLEFKQRVLDISQRLGCDPNHLMSAMAFETGETFSPAKRNPKSGATGLIQFMPPTARDLHTTTDDLKNMTAVDQLDFVEKYLQPFKGKMNSLSDVYATILFPAAVGKTDSSVLFQRPSVAYNQNKGLDTNGDGVVTKGEAASKVQEKLDKGLHRELIG